MIRGGLPEEGNGNVVYAAYVAVIAALVYGVPASRAFFEFVDPAWISRHLTGVQGVLVVGASSPPCGWSGTGWDRSGGRWCPTCPTSTTSRSARSTAPWCCGAGGG